MACFWIVLQRNFISFLKYNVRNCCLFSFMPRSDFLSLPHSPFSVAWLNLKKRELSLLWQCILSTYHRRYKKNPVHAVKIDQPTNCTRNVCTERPFVLIKCVLKFINLLKDCLVSKFFFGYLCTFAHLSRFITDEDFFFHFVSTGF